MVNDLYTKFNRRDSEYCNPYNVFKIIMADDDIMCNTALKTMLEKLGKIQVYSFYNGVNVIFFCNYPFVGLQML